MKFIKFEFGDGTYELIKLKSIEGIQIREKLTFNFLNGDRVYLVCKECYKILASSITKNNKIGD